MTEPEDPPRWSQGAGAPPGLSSLLSVAQNDGPSDTELSALRARLGPQLNAAPSAAGSSAMPPLAKLATGALIAALGVAAALYVQHRNAPTNTNHELLRTPTPTGGALPALSSTTAPQPPSPGVPSADAQPAAAPSASSKAHSAGLASTATRRPIAAQSEALLLEEARRELASNPARALALTTQHGTQFPRGSLSQEREVIAISALRRLGRTTEAEARAARFDALYPKSAHQHAVDGSPSR